MIKVVIVDDQKVVTQGLKALLEAEPDIDIVGTGANGQEAIDLVSALSPDVLLIDQYMPVMDGVVATQIICRRFPSVSVLMLSGSEPDETITAVLQAGAQGYLLKSTSAEDLANSIRSVHRGYSQMSPGLMQKLLAGMNTASPALPTVTRSPEDELLKTLSDLLINPNQFELEPILVLLERVETPDLAASLMTQIDKKLQRNPGHVSALYLAGQLIMSFNQHSRLAINYFRLAYQHAQTQGFSLTARLQICQAAWVANAAESQVWLQELLQTWPPSQSHYDFFSALENIFGRASLPYRLLKAGWEIQMLGGLCDQADRLKSKLTLSRYPLPQ